MDERVDILVANCNTLPWLRLLISQVNRLGSTPPNEIHVFDSGSTDGSKEWLSENGIHHYVSPERVSHAQGISKLISISTAPYVAFLDVDAIPVLEGWLDEAVEAIRNEKTGAAGLRAGSVNGYHRIFTHPSFCVLRRKLYTDLGLSLGIVHDYAKNTAFDVGERLCATLEDNGYVLKYVGEGAFNPAIETGNKVVHFGMSTIGLSKGAEDDSWRGLVREVVAGHQRLLGHFGLWSEFRMYLQEASVLNPYCSRYLG